MPLALTRFVAITMAGSVKVAGMVVRKKVPVEMAETLRVDWNSKGKRTKKVVS